jgi:hypothetical protein
MAVVTRNRQPPAVAHRFGYLAAVVCGVVMLYLVNVWPGWQVVPFLTADVSKVLGLLNFSLGLGVALNVVYLVTDPRRWKRPGDLVSTAVGLAVLMRFWQVFPFDFTAAPFDWALLVRGLLVLAIAGCLIGLVVQFVTLIRALLVRGGGDR